MQEQAPWPLLKLRGVGMSSSVPTTLNSNINTYTATIRRPFTLIKYTYLHPLLEITLPGRTIANCTNSHPRSASSMSLSPQTFITFSKTNSQQDIPSCHQPLLWNSSLLQNHLPSGQEPTTLLHHPCQPPPLFPGSWARIDWRSDTVLRDLQSTSRAFYNQFRSGADYEKFKI